MIKALRIHPATFLFFLLLITGYSTFLFPFTFAIILHELGHAYTAKRLGYQLNKIWILPFGACLSFNEFSFDPKDEIKIALSGPIVNVILILITITLWWIFPITYTYTYSFAIANFSIAFFNLLPVYPLDGGRVMTSFLRINLKPKKVFKIAVFINYIFTAVFIILFIISLFLNINFSFITIAIFLFISTFEGKFQGRYSPLLFQYSNKVRNKPVPVKSFCVSSSTPFYRIIPELNNQKYNLIYVLYPNQSLKVFSETQLKQVLEMSSLECSFDNIERKIL